MRKLTIIATLVLGSTSLNGLGGMGAAAGTIEGVQVMAQDQALIRMSELPSDTVTAQWVVPFLESPPAGLSGPTSSQEPTPSVPGPAPEADPPTLATSFQALGDNNTVIPPDTHGAVGLSHVMTTLNSEVRVQTRTGGVLTTTSLASFWSSLSGVSGTFDPKVLYDPYASRWMFTAMSNSASAASSVLIGASTTSDPTGSWSLYRFDADGADSLWADYPSMGFNKDWIVVSVNMFTNSVPYTFTSAKVFTFNKATLYAGGAATATIFSLTGTGGTQVPAITYSTTLSTMHLLQNYNGDSSGSGHLRMYTITGAVGSEVLTTGGFVSTPNPWANGAPGGADLAPQLGSSAKIQANDARIQNLVFRNGSLWATHTIFLPASGATRSSVQWWQLSTAGAITQRGRVDDSTGAKFYAFPSIAVNSSNDLLIGYTRFSATEYASAYYSFRNASNPINTLQSEILLKSGEAKYLKLYSGTRNRWGDYSSTVVDPVNDTDFWTVQEYAWTPGGGFDRWSTWWGRLTLGALATLSPSSAAFGTQAVGVTSATVTFTLTSSGVGALTVGTVTITGVDPGQFVLSSDTCSGKTVAAGLGCSVKVAFAPNSAGSKSATLVVPTNAAGSPHTSALSGTAAVDSVAPFSTFTTPSGTVGVYPLSTVAGTTADALAGVSSVAVVYVSAIGLPAVIVAGSMSCPTFASCTWSAALPSTPGPYTAFARGTDRVGNAEFPGPSISLIVL